MDKRGGLAASGANRVGIGRAIPLWLKIAISAMALLYLPKLFIDAHISETLWICNVTLCGVVLGLWLESRLILSMMLVGSLLIMLGWTVDFVSGATALGYVGFVFDPEIALWERLLALDHIVLAFVPLWVIWRIGYDSRAAVAQIGLMFCVMIATYVFSDPHLNMNWVYGPGAPQSTLPPLLYLALHATLSPIILILPAHAILLYTLGDRRPDWMPRAARRDAGQPAE